MVIFSVVPCSAGDLKLVGGSVVSAGRLQICFNKRWSTINADRWTEQYTKVACKQLGYSTEGYYHNVISVHSKCMSVYNSNIQDSYTTQ